MVDNKPIDISKMAKTYEPTVPKKVMAVEQKALYEKIKLVTIVGAISLIAVLGLLVMNSTIAYIVVASIVAYLLFEYKKAQEKILYLSDNYGV